MPVLSNSGKINPYLKKIKNPNGGYISPTTQAAEMFQEFTERLKDPTAKIAVTYSANNAQAKSIISGYTTGHHEIAGANQAEVFNELTKLIKAKNLQDRIHVLPVTTMQYDSRGTMLPISDKEVERDTANIARHLGAGWTVLGLQNESTPQGEYAIGGGVATHWKGSQQQKKCSAALKAMTTQDISNLSINDPNYYLKTAYDSGKAQPDKLARPKAPGFLARVTGFLKNPFGQTTPVVPKQQAVVPKQKEFLAAERSAPAIKYQSQLSDTGLHGQSLPYIDLPASNNFFGVVSNSGENSQFVGGVPIKHNRGPYGNWPNTTSCNIGRDPNRHQCPITQTTYRDGTPLVSPIHWKCSEVAYHAQKLLDYQRTLTDPAKIQLLNGLIKEMEFMPSPPETTFLPRKHWDPIVAKLGNLKADFDNKADAGYRTDSNRERMEFVVGLKLEQHPELKEQAKFFAAKGLIPIEYSRYDDTWASGKNGDGLNWLGRIIYKLGAEALEKEGGTPMVPITQIDAAYDSLRTSQNAGSLSHNGIEASFENPKSMPLITDQLAQHVGAVLAAYKEDTSAAKPIVDSKSAKGRVLNKISGAVDLEVADDKKDAKQKVLQVKFDNTAFAAAFAQSVGSPASFKSGDTTVVLGPNRAQQFFQKNGIATHGIDSKYPIMHALFHEQQKGQAPKPIESMPVSQLPVDPNSAKGRVLKKVSEIAEAAGGYGALNLEVADDINVSGQKVLKLKFDDVKDAAAFVKLVGLKGSVHLNNSDDRTVVLDSNGAQKFFENNKIATHGRTNPHPMMKALLREQEQTPQESGKRKLKL